MFLLVQMFIGSLFLLWGIQLTSTTTPENQAHLKESYDKVCVKKNIYKEAIKDPSMALFQCGQCYKQKKGLFFLVCPALIHTSRSNYCLEAIHSLEKFIELAPSSSSQEDRKEVKKAKKKYADLLRNEQCQLEYEAEKARKEKNYTKAIKLYSDIYIKKLLELIYY